MKETKVPKPNPEPVPPSLPAEPFITKPEVARRLCKPIRTITNWMRRDWIPYHKMGRAVLFKWSEVEAKIIQGCSLDNSPEKPNPTAENSAPGPSSAPAKIQ